MQQQHSLPTQIVTAAALTILAIALAVMYLPASSTLASPDQVNNIADILHPDIHQTVGQGDGANANPNGNGNGGQIHGIGNAQGGNGGVANLGNVHGGIAEVNKNVD